MADGSIALERQIGNALSRCYHLPIDPIHMKKTTLDIVRVYRSPLNHRQGLLVAGRLQLPCALGRNGISHSKREGDLATPVGTFPFRKGFYRADRLLRPRTRLPLTQAQNHDGWCDDIHDRRYNRQIRLPDPARHETIKRDDHLYDVVVDFGYNERPRVKGRGSAVFLHLARPGFKPTEGCVAVSPTAIRRLMELIGPKTKLQIVATR